MKDTVQMRPKRQTRNQRGMQRGKLLNALLVLAILLSSSCQNGRTTRRLALTSSSELPNTEDSSSPLFPNAPSYTVSSITVEADAQLESGSAITLLMDQTRSSSTPLTDFCTTEGSRVCVCEFRWDEVNLTEKAPILIPRKATTNVDSVQLALLGCPAPAPYKSEILDQTKIRVRVVPAPGNDSQFNVLESSFVKGGAPKKGEFQDSKGRAFDNIVRYTCYDKIVRGMTILNWVEQVTDPQSGQSKPIALASRFCAKGYDENSDTPGAGCEGLASVERQASAQSFYYNLYLRKAQAGDFNIENQRYTCPRVQEILDPGRNANTQVSPWPMDSSFALALAPSKDYPIGVEAFSRVSQAGDPLSFSSSCSSEATPGNGGDSPDEQSLVRSCLGFAAAPGADGTCPMIKKSDGTLMQTYRLRRFTVLYPPVFDTNGQPISGQGQSADTIYVLDRPVKSPSSATTQGKPYTQLGPKPCPFAMFDRKGVLTPPGPAVGPYKDGIPRYAGTNNAGWARKNIDGIMFPNEDVPGVSCAAALPVLNDARNTFSIATVHQSNPALKEVFIRPVQPWAPHYLEHTDFKACAPLPSTGIQDPPLHFARRSDGSTSYCAEVYPTQNMGVEALEIAPTNGWGQVKPYTSHSVKNSISNDCTFTRIDLPANTRIAYPSNGKATHPGDLKTCDRTETSTTPGVPYFPLLAPEEDVEKALKTDSSYGCAITYDNGGTKSQRGQTPQAGCCGSSVRDYSAAHLEPGSKCESPNY